METIIEDRFDEAFYKHEDLTKYADEFSEGDNLLKETLLNLWNNNIKTNSCCMGHETEIYSIPPYLSIVIDNNSMSLIFELFSKLYLNYKDVTLGLSNNINNEDSFTIHMRGNTKVDTLNIINQSIGNDNDKDIQLLNDALLLMKYANEASLITHISITSDKVYIEFRNPNDNTTNIEYKSFDEAIELLSNISDISHLFIMCDSSELDTIVNIINLNKKTNTI